MFDLDVRRAARRGAASRARGSVARLIDD